MSLIRDYVGVSAWCEAAQIAMETACYEAAKTQDDLTDIINVALEELVRQRYELPAFSTILRTARAARTEINQLYHRQVRDSLSNAALEQLSALLNRANEDTQSAWDRYRGGGIGALKPVPDGTHQSVRPLRSQTGSNSGAIGAHPDFAHASAVRSSVAGKD